MDSLNTVLKEQAVGLGLCDEWTREWDHDLDDYEFCDRFKRGQDFCIKHEYPSLDVIRRCFDSASLAKFGVFVDSLESSPMRMYANGTYVLLGDCSGTMRFPRWSCAVVYVRHDSRIRIEAGEFARISVRLYDNAEVEIAGNESAVINIRDKRH